METRVLARLATAIENREPAALSTLDTLEPGQARIVGITGPPGAVKSTLVDALGGELRRQGKTVAILAVDPTSRRTGGAGGLGAAPWARAIPEVKRRAARVRRERWNMVASLLVAGTTGRFNPSAIALR